MVELFSVFEISVRIQTDVYFPREIEDDNVDNPSSASLITNKHFLNSERLINIINYEEGFALFTFVICKSTYISRIYLFTYIYSSRTQCMMTIINW